MTQQPFSRPGAIDLSGLKRPAAGAPQTPGGDGGAAPAGGASYWLDVTEETFQSTVEASLTAPVLLVFYSPTRLPESQQMARDLATVAEEYEGRFLAGLVDIDTQPAIAQAVQLQSVPFVFAVIDGRPQPLLQDVLTLDSLRTAVNQVMQQLTAQGITGRHQPRQAGPAAETEDGEPPLDPRYAPAQEALAAGDYDTAVAEYERLLKANPADAEAAAGLAMAKVLQRASGADATAARAAADASPDDVAAQTLAADVDLLDGNVDDAFARLVELVRRTSDADRNAAREHLLGLFAAVGNDDPRVLKGRQALANALF
ncbi:co-chaperone YbbN [Nocardioides halotolerans]|uniref:co-chaperone YbbN n=1 Tax=Nocardioides halotolerans TaxID=433660 RepID=UPI00042050C1|nr:tetratricopeptide repeat protein [Nocardioides halotolerans]